MWKTAGTDSNGKTEVVHASTVFYGWTTKYDLNSITTEKIGLLTKYYDRLCTAVHPSSKYSQPNKHPSQSQCSDIIENEYAKDLFQNEMIHWYNGEKWKHCLVPLLCILTPVVFGSSSHRCGQSHRPNFSQVWLVKSEYQYYKIISNLWVKTVWKRHPSSFVKNRVKASQKWPKYKFFDF